MPTRGPGGSRWPPQRGKIEESLMKGLFREVWRFLPTPSDWGRAGSGERGERHPQEEWGM